MPPYIPADLLTPCTVTPSPPSGSQGEHARKVLRLLATNDCNAQKILSIAAIVTTPPKGK